VANSPSQITRSVSLADLLATLVSDGTYADVVGTAKTDELDKAAAATDIPEHAGQLWSNLVDDAAQAFVDSYYHSSKLWQTTDSAEREALGSDDGLIVDQLAYGVDDGILYVCTAVLGGSSSSWTTITATGTVAGPGSATNNAVARWDGAGGATIQDSVVVISDAGAVTGVASIAVSGLVDGRDVSADGVALDAHLIDIANPHSTNIGLALAVGNDTDGHDVVLTVGDQILGEDGGSIEFDAVTGLLRTTDAIVVGDLEVTGKLTVAGLIDPTGLVLTSQAAAPHTPTATEGVLWYDNASPPVLYSTTTAGTAVVNTSSTNDLATALALGNATGGTSIEVTDGDAIYFADAATGTEGGVLYDHASDTLRLRAATVTAIAVDGTAIKPVSDGTQALGTNGNGWSTCWFTEQSAAPSATATHGAIYVDDSAPNELYYLDDTGRSRNLSRPPVLCLTPGNGSTVSTVTIEATSFVPYVALPPTGTSQISWTVALPWTAPAAATYTLRIRWAGSGSGAGNIRMSASVRRWFDGESLGTLNASATLATIAANGTANLQLTSTVSASMSIDSAQPGDTITVTLRRLGDDGADTYASDARVVSCELLETIV